MSFRLFHSDIKFMGRNTKRELEYVKQYKSKLKFSIVPFNAKGNFLFIIAIS